ncbi:hypothetical protein [Erythrobacter sp. Alg231-14]|uniref:hypothetical protein n=1 Tax=Erythrobacter sp. Alg231-14 TaxID=1922225 RepID=UPI000D5575E9
MPKSLAQQTVRLDNRVTPALPNMEDPAWARWQGHVFVGNIGTGPQTTAQQAARHARNERLLCGERVPRIWET